MKVWPKNNKVASFSDLADPCIEAVRTAYELTPTGKPITWTGYETGQAEKACVPDPDVLLSPEWLKQSEEDQGRDPLTEIIGVAIRQGIEQGRRMEMERLEFTNRSLDRFFESLKKMKGIPSLIAQEATILQSLMGRK